jgi:hypothetical protein
MEPESLVLCFVLLLCLPLDAILNQSNPAHMVISYSFFSSIFNIIFQLYVQGTHPCL